MAVIKRLAIVLVIAVSPLIVGLLLTYDIIKIDWVSFMEIQPSYRPMEAPLPLPASSVPVQGAAIISAAGAPQNPVEANEISIAAGLELYSTHCALCHGITLEGTGPFSAFLQNKPSNLLEGQSVNSSDGYMFVVITNGLEGKMPSMIQNLPFPKNRWDVINYIRSVQKGQ